MAALTAERTGRMHDIVATIQPSRTGSSAPTSAARSSSRAAPAPARPRSRSTARRSCSTRIASGCRPPACSSSGRRGRSSSTSRPSCPRSARPASSHRRSARLYPGVDAFDEDRPAVAALKGSADMARLLQKAVKSRQVVPAADQTIEVDGERIVVRPRSSSRRCSAPGTRTSRTTSPASPSTSRRSTRSPTSSPTRTGATGASSTTPTSRCSARMSDRPTT